MKDTSDIIAGLYRRAREIVSLYGYELTFEALIAYAYLQGVMDALDKKREEEAGAMRDVSEKVEAGR